MNDKTIRIHKDDLSTGNEGTNKMDKSKNEKGNNNNRYRRLYIGRKPREKNLVIPRTENGSPNILKESKNFGKKTIEKRTHNSPTKPTINSNDNSCGYRSINRRHDNARCARGNSKNPRERS